MLEQLVRYESPAEAVARIVMTRSEKHNSLNPDMIFAIEEAFNRAKADDSVKVVILAAEGRNFSAGHDLGETIEQYQEKMHERGSHASDWSGFLAPGAHGWYASEQAGYIEPARRIRNFPKPTICAVQGKCIAGALIYAWVCDIIIAADNAQFTDPVVTFGSSGVEWLAHPWELGARKAKEFLFTSDSWSAEEAWRLGMVNHVVPLDNLPDFALDMAVKIAKKPAFALALAKKAVNKTLDIQGQENAIDQAFTLHHLCHQHNFRLFGYGMDTSDLPAMAKTPDKV